MKLSNGIALPTIGMLQLLKDLGFSYSSFPGLHRESADTKPTAVAQVSISTAAKISSKD